MVELPHLFDHLLNVLLARVLIGQIPGDQPGVNLDPSQGIAYLMGNPSQHLAQLRIPCQQLASHLLHRLSQISQFVPRRTVHRLVQMASTDLPSSSHQFLDRPGDRPRQPQGHHHGDQRSQQSEQFYRTAENCHRVDEPRPDVHPNHRHHYPIGGINRRVASHVWHLVLVKQDRITRLACQDLLHLQPVPNLQMGILPPDAPSLFCIQQTAPLPIKDVNPSCPDHLPGAL